MSELLQRVSDLRESYNRVKRALPWLDASLWPDDPPAFPDFAAPVSVPSVATTIASPSMLGTLHELQTTQRASLLRYSPDTSASGAEFSRLLNEMEALRFPLVILHTDMTWEKIDELAGQHPHLPIVIESGPLKILYHLESIEKILLKHANTYLSTYNFCNWQGIERLCKVGLGARLLYGSHSPRFSPDAAMGPIVMGRYSWKLKCDIAGNNLRRLIGMEELHPPEAAFVAPAAFIVDSHTHCVTPSGKEPRAASRVLSFPTPDIEFTPSEWIEFMNGCALERLYLMPLEALKNPDETCQRHSEHLRQHAAERMFYLEIFNPNGGEEHWSRLRASLQDRACLGIKIHPSFHGVKADDRAYAPIYQLANELGKPILTHSWDVSTYNPTQHLSHPNRFRAHLNEYPQTRLVLGHAGGRPGAFESVVNLCRDFANVSVDLAGDYYDNGLIDALANRIGVERVLYGSDVNWIDPRCNLAPVLVSSLQNTDVLAVLRTNAQRVFRG